jgi:hypothetical protein
MTKEFIPMTEALALKELGFDEPCIAMYNSNGFLFIGEELSIAETEVLAPLYQQAFRWFREKHKLVFNFISYNIVKPGEYHWSITWNDEAKASGIVKTYEEAEQACLDKLIEICKNK